MQSEKFAGRFRNPADDLLQAVQCPQCPASYQHKKEKKDGNLLKNRKKNYIFSAKNEKKSGNVQFSTQNQVKSKNSDHVRRSPIFHAQSSQMSKKLKMVIFHAKASEE